MQSVAASPVERPQVSYDEYLALTVDDRRLIEWVNGEVVYHVPPTPRHQEIVGFVFALLSTFSRFFKLGKVYAAPLEMRMEQLGISREPDILFVSTANLSRVRDARLEGPSDLIVEVISDDSAARDRGAKFYEYQQAGVREYWIIDPRPGRERADFWVLDSSGRYRPIAVGDDGIYRSTVLPDFWLQTDWLFGQELPDPLMSL